MTHPPNKPLAAKTEPELPGNLGTYVAMVQALLEHRRLTLLGDAVAADALLLRHDVDLDLSWAVQMALAESARGWRATYFFSLQAPTFNLLSQEGREAMSALRELGHRVGLHVDARWIDDVTLRAVCAWLQLPAEFVTFHAPARGQREEPCTRMLPRPIAYRSDSGATWQYGDPHSVSADVPLLLNTHPIWWVPPGTREHRLAAAGTGSSAQAVLEWLPKLGPGLRGTRQ